ncbi:hypothetical protein ACHAW6_012781 [Cyclotella cf. meneghiniana]
MNEPIEHETTTTSDASPYDDVMARNPDADADAPAAEEEELTQSATPGGADGDGLHDFVEAATMAVVDQDDADGTDTDLAMAEPSIEDHQVAAPLLPPMPTPADSSSTSPSPTPEEIQQEHSCKCLKSRCLKLYCDCFRHNSTCSDACSCHACHNTHAQNGPGGARTLAMLAILRGRPGAFDAGVPIQRGRNEESVVAAYQEGKRVQMEEEEYAAAPVKRGRARSAVSVREDGVMSPTKLKKIKPSKWTLPALDPIPIPQYTVEQVLSEFPPLIDPPPFTIDEYPTLALDPSTDYSSLVNAFKEPLFKDPSPPLQLAYAYRDHALAQRSYLHDKKTDIVERLDAIRRQFAATKAELINLNLLLKQNSQKVGGWTHKVFELELTEKPCGFNEKLEKLREFVERYGVLPSHGMKRLNFVDEEGDKKEGETDGEDFRANSEEGAEGERGYRHEEGGVKIDSADTKSPVVSADNGAECIEDVQQEGDVKPVRNIGEGAVGNKDVEQEGDVNAAVDTDEGAEDREDFQPQDDANAVLNTDEGAEGEVDVYKEEDVNLVGNTNEGVDDSKDIQKEGDMKHGVADDKDSLVFGADGTNTDVTPMEETEEDANITKAVAKQGTAVNDDEGETTGDGADVSVKVELPLGELQPAGPSVEDTNEDLNMAESEQSVDQLHNKQLTEEKENEQPSEQLNREINIDPTEKQQLQPHFTEEETKSLATFISAMKLKVKKNKSLAKLYPHRIRALQECGVRLFENENDARFDVMFEKLLAYKKEMGTFRMPSLDLCKDSGDEELIALHNWVFSQIGSFRYQLKTKKVRDVQKFLDVGFSFEKWYGSNGHVFERDIPAFDAMARKYVENGGVVPPEYEEMMRGQGKFAGRKRKSLHGPKVKRYSGPDRRLKRNRAPEFVDAGRISDMDYPTRDERKQHDGMIVEAVDEQVSDVKMEPDSEVEDQPSFEVVAMDV